MPALRQTLDRSLVALLFAAGFALLFRGWLFTGFDGMFGDDSDGEIALALIDHWRHVFAGDTRWPDPTFFFPERGTLGYTDAFFLVGAAYAALFGLGFDPFAAFMLVMAGLAAVGFFGFVRLATRHFGVPLRIAAVGAFLFAFANVDAVKIIHAQSYCAMLLPALCCLALAAWASEGRARGLALAGAGGLLHAALFLTAYQTAWFFTLCLLLLALFYPLVFGPAASRARLGAMRGAKLHVLLAYGAAFAVGIVPFLALYLPVLLSGRVRDFAEVAANAPEWRDFLNVTPGNAVWGELLRVLGIAGRPDRPPYEVELAFTPAVLAVFFATLLTRPGWRGAQTERDRAVLLIGLAVVALWLLQFEYFGVRPWQAVWALVPGAGAIRYVFRSQMVANLFVCLVVARGLAGLERFPAKRIPVRRQKTRQIKNLERIPASTEAGTARASTALPRGAVAACAGLLLVEQINLDWPVMLSRRDTLAWLDAVPAPPPGCRAFYVVPNPYPGDKPSWVHQADAMLLSQLRGIPTVSGYSSWFPAGWDMEDPARPGYAAAVRDWAQRRAVEGLCGLEPRRGVWTPGLP